MNSEEVILVYKNKQLPGLFSSFTAWGYTHLSAGSRGWVIHDFLYKSQSDQLIVQFDDKSKLVIEAPAHISVHDDAIEIREAKSVTYEWVDLLSSGLKSKRYYISFINDGKTVLGKNNVHWSFIDANDLSVKRSALIISGKKE